MGDTGSGLSPREAVLVILDAAGGVVAGRTVVQKMAYFSAKALDDDLGHHAHYFGPYSREVERALTHAALSEDVDETVERFAGWRGGPEIRLYTYALSEQGRELTRRLRTEYPDACDVIDDVVRRLDEAVPDRNQHTLSLAAKTDLILSQLGDQPDVRDVPGIAGELDWELSDSDVNQAVDVLRVLGEREPAA